MHVPVPIQLLEGPLRQRTGLSDQRGSSLLGVDPFDIHGLALAIG